ncbi:TonB-dependent receptor [Geofilum rhodophaeum]|uniref:TonB-dependent receptor n=1 Tax=Geofilum rhodophaeum TaxID=1965019 RepID=UPI000B5251B5|nr:TonB-dependent receptor [Geofilum rhodophaeum]
MKHIGIVLLLFIATLAQAQKGTIRGTVYEKNTGETLVGVSVVLEGTFTGTSTDLDGKFSLEVDPGVYNLQISFISFQPLTINDVVVKAGEVSLLNEIMLSESSVELQDVVVTARALRNTEAALQTIKRSSSAMLDGISAAKMGLIGDATAVEAAKRVTGVSIEGGKYIYVRGLGDRYSKTTLNNVEIPGLDPDRNSLQMDIFPTNLIENMLVSKNFTADMPADFTGGLMNVETRDFPEEKSFNVSFSTTYNPDMHLQDDFLTYEGGKLDFLGMDDGTRALPSGARADRIPVPYSGVGDQQVGDFVQSFNPQLGAKQQRNLVDYSVGLSLGNQVNVGDKGDGRLGYIFSLSYKVDYKHYNEVRYGNYQNVLDANHLGLRYATVQDGAMSEENVLVGLLGGLAYKNQNNKLRLMLMHLQNGENRAARFNIDNSPAAIGQSGYLAESDNLEYNQRGLSNLLLHGQHKPGGGQWDIDWRLSPTFSSSEDPDIRKSAFTIQPNGNRTFSAGAGGNPSRIWRELTELNATARIDVTRSYTFRDQKAELKFGAVHNYKQRDYEILFYDLQFTATQVWPQPDLNTVLLPENIFPNRPNGVYYQSGNNKPNPNEYQSAINNSAFYISNEFYPVDQLKAIVGLRAENFVQTHTGRDQKFANGDAAGRNLDGEKVLNSFDLFPTLNLIYQVSEQQNLRASYARTVARPSFKELSFAQILDPISNTIFNGGLYTYGDWDGQLSESYIQNFDLRWELFFERGQNVSASVFYKQFSDPIELVRIPEQQTSTEYQPRNVGEASLYGIEFEFNQGLDLLSPMLSGLSVNGNLTLVQSKAEMPEAEYNARKAYEKTGQNIARERAMAGQSPWVVNAGLVYAAAEKGWDAGLFYNVKGPTLLIVGAGLFPDIYQSPFHSLNLSLSKKLGEEQRTSLSFKASNLLNQDQESYYEAYGAANETYSYRAPGRSFSVGLSHRF